MRRLLILATILGLAGNARASTTIPDLDAEVGLIPDEQRAAVRDAFMEEEPFLDVKGWSTRPSKDTLARMQAVAGKWPQSAAVQAYLAEAAEAAGDHAVAEQAWRAAIAASNHAPWTLHRLAELYAVRLQPEKQIATLDELTAALTAQLPKAGVREQLHAAYDEAIALIAVHDLTSVDAAKYRRAVIALFPDDPSYLTRWIDELVTAGDHAKVRAEIERWEKTFPGQATYFAKVRADLYVAEKNPDAAIAVWRQLLLAQPEAKDAGDRWDMLIDLLRSTGRLDDRQADLERRQASHAGLPPQDFAELFAIYMHGSHEAQARTLLADARDHHAPSPSDERALLTRAHMHLRLVETGQAIRYLTGAASVAQSVDLREQATYELGETLLAEGTARVGLTPLDVFDAFALDRVDTGPSIAGGLASLVFHRQWSPARAGDLEHVSALYGNGLRAEQVLAAAEQQWPKSPKTAKLAFEILGTYRAYHRDEAVIAMGTHYVATWPDGEDAVHAELAKAESLRTLKRVALSDASYASALARAETRSPAEADTVLDQYIAVLIEEHRETDVVALYWKQIQRRPDDPRGYERLDEFLSSVRLYDEELKVYSKALAEFKDQSWNQKLARWTIARKGEAAFRELTRKLLLTFSGTEAEEYLKELVSANFREVKNDKTLFYEAIYKMALDRFPFRPAFVRSLLALYDGSGRSADADALVERYAGIDPEMRQRLIVTLGRNRKLDATLTRLATPRGRSERLFEADLLVWMSRQEDALPLVRALCVDWPADGELAERAANLEITAAAVGDVAATRRAVGFWDAMAVQYPADTIWLDHAASALAETGDLPEAKKRWERMLAARKGDADMYVQLAAAYWDWFLFDDAARAIETARARHADPLLYWDKQGAIYESAGDPARAAREYVLAFIDAAAGHAGHSAVETPDAKLAKLVARQPGNQDLVRKTFVTVVGERPKDGDVELAYTRWLRAADLIADSHTELAAGLRRFADDRVFLEAAAGDAKTLRWTDIAVDAQQRLLELNPGKAARTLELAAALEAANRDRDAEITFIQLIARLAWKGPDSGGVLLDAYARYADFLTRHHRDTDALAVRRKAADSAAGTTRDALLFDLGWRLAGMDRYADAETLFRGLRQLHPGELRYLDATADMVAKTAKDATAAGEAHKTLYTLALKDAHDLDLSDDAHKELVAGIRRSYITRLEAAGLHVDAVDQWIEIIDRDPDREDLVADGLDYARRHDQVDRYLGAFTKTAAKSFKDVRWPLVLAEIDARIGKPADAALALDKALEIRPDRIELRTRQIDAYIAAGDYAAADKAYDVLDKLVDHDSSYFLPHARVAAHLGKKDRAIELVEAYVTAQSTELPARCAVAAAVLTEAGYDVEAVAMYRRGLDAIVASPFHSDLNEAYLVATIDAAVRINKTKDMLATIRAARDQIFAAYNKAVGQADAHVALDAVNRIDAVVTHKVILLVADILDADAAELGPTLDQLVAATPAKDKAALVAKLRDAGLVERAMSLAQSLLSGATGSSADALQALILGMYADRGADRQLLASLGQLKGRVAERWLELGAGAARRLGDVAAERALLAQAWDALDTDHVKAKPNNLFTFASPVIARSLELMKDGNDRVALEAAARRGGLGARQVVEWLYDAGEPELALVAVNAAADKLERPKWWRAGAEAVLRDAHGERGERTQQLFQQVLARRSIGDTVGKPLAPDERIADESWTKWAWRYAGVIGASPAAPFVPAMSDYAFIAAEQHPLGSASYEKIGELYLTAKDGAHAERFFRLALTLKPGNWKAIDGVARSQLVRGDKTAALATWKTILDDAGTPPSEANGDKAVLYYADSLNAAGLHDEARAALRARLESRYATAEPAAGAALAIGFAALYEAPDHGPGGPVDKVFRALLEKDRRPWLVYVVLTGQVQGPKPREMADHANGDSDDSDGEPGDEPPSRQEPGDSENDSNEADTADTAGPPTNANDALLTAEAREPYYRDMATMVALSENPASAERWQHRMIDELIAIKRFDRALAATQELLAQRKGDVPYWMVSSRAAALIGLGKGDDAAVVLTDRVAHTMDVNEMSHAVALLTDGELVAPAARLTLKYYARRGDVSSMKSSDWLLIAGAQLDLADHDGAVHTLESFALASPADVSALDDAAVLLEARKLYPAAIAFRQKIVVATPRLLDNQLLLAKDRAAAGDEAGGLDAATAILGDRRASRALRGKASAFVVELGGRNAAHCVTAVGARADGTPFDEATFVALAACKRAAGDAAGADAALARAAKDGVIPTAALVALGNARVAANDAKAGEALLERAIFLSANRPVVRIALYQARHALGNLPGAAGALNGRALDIYCTVGATDEANGARVRAALAGIEELGPDGVRLAPEAGLAAEQGGDWLAAAFFHDVAALARPSDATTPVEQARAKAALHKAAEIEARGSKHLIAFGEES